MLTNNKLPCLSGCRLDLRFLKIYDEMSENILLGKDVSVRVPVSLQLRGGESGETVNLFSVGWLAS